MIGCGEGDSDLREGAVGSLSNDWSIKSRKEGRRSGEVTRTGGRGWNGVQGLESEMVTDAGLVAVASGSCGTGVQGLEGEKTWEISRGIVKPGLEGTLPHLGIGRFYSLVSNLRRAPVTRANIPAYYGIWPLKVHDLLWAP